MEEGFRNDENNQEDFIIECECGQKWNMDEEPTPYECVGTVWRIWLGNVPGIWVDPDGNEINKIKDY